MCPRHEASRAVTGVTGLHGTAAEDHEMPRDVASHASRTSRTVKSDAAADMVGAAGLELRGAFGEVRPGLRRRLDQYP